MEIIHSDNSLARKRLLEWHTAHCTNGTRADARRYCYEMNLPILRGSTSIQEQHIKLTLPGKWDEEYGPPPYLLINPEDDTIFVEIGDLLIEDRARLSPIKHLAMRDQHDYLATEAAINQFGILAKTLQSISLIDRPRVDEVLGEYKYNRTLQYLTLDLQGPRDENSTGVPYFFEENLDKAAEFQEWYEGFRKKQEQWKNVKIGTGLLAAKSKDKEQWALHYKRGLMEDPAEDYDTIYHWHEEPIEIDWERMTVRTCKPIVGLERKDRCRFCMRQRWGLNGDAFWLENWR